MQPDQTPDLGSSLMRWRFDALAAWLKTCPRFAEGDYPDPAWSDRDSEECGNALPALLRAARERDELREERDKYAYCARQFCGAHVGLPQARCPACERDELRARAEKAEARVKELEFAEAELKYRKMLTSPTPAQIEAAREALREAIPHLSVTCSDECPILAKARAALAGLEGRS